MDRIVCVGKNYSEHIEELGGKPTERPVIFIKPASVLKVAKPPATLSLTLPDSESEYHHECEIVLKLAAGGYRVSAKDATEMIDGISLGLDLTNRSLQSNLKKNGHPWTVSKVFPDSAVVGPWIGPASFTKWMEEPFSLSIDGIEKQKGTARQMTFSPFECISFISEFIPLCAGDLIYTGTPRGVGPIQVGQTGQLTWGPLTYEVSWTGYGISQKT